MADILSEQAKACLANVSQQCVFKCHDGRILRNMQELADALTLMTDEIYAFHVSKEKNDFALWMREIIKDEWLADYLQKASTRSQAAWEVATRVTMFSRWLNPDSADKTPQPN